MSSQSSFGSSMLFQTINDDLNASMTTADELSKEFNSMLKEASSSNTQAEVCSPVSREKLQPSGLSSPSISTRGSIGSSAISSSPQPYSASSTAVRSLDSVLYGSNNSPASPVFSTSPLSSPKIHREPQFPVARAGSDSHSYGKHSPKHSPHMPRHDLPSGYDRSPHGSPTYMERSPCPSPTAAACDHPFQVGRRSPRPDRSPSPNPISPSFDKPSQSTPFHSQNLLSPYDNSQMGRRSPRPSRSPSRGPAAPSFDQPSQPAPFQSQSLLSPYDNSQMGRRSPRTDRSPSPLRRNMPNTQPKTFRQPDEGVQQQKSPSKWNETDLDVSYERKPHHTYDKTEWLRPSLPNSGWRESNLDGPSPTQSPKSPRKNPRSKAVQYPHGSLSRNTRVSVPPDVSSPVHSPYHPQPITSRISIPPTSTQHRQRRPIPLSIIMRLQNPHWGAMQSRHPRVLGGEGDMAIYQPAELHPREFFNKPVTHPHPPELRQPVVFNDVLNPGDVDAELERLDYVHHMPRVLENPSMTGGSREVEQEVPRAPRPLSPTRLQPVVAPEANSQEIPDLEELLRIRAEFPRALKKRGSVDRSVPLKKASHYQPNQYKNLIDKLFRRKDLQRGEHGSESSSSSEGEEGAMPPTRLPQTPTTVPHDFRSYHSILRRSNRERKGSGKRARLSPLVLLLDGALVGEMETVQKAAQKISDPSQPNDEGITALHNAICGGHYNVVDFLVRIGANVSAPDSHGWTPLHCAGSCNDRPLCEFLVRNGAAVMAMTHSDGATASQKCDPYAEGFEECDTFLRGVEEAMGMENSGVLYALWSYPAQAADELSFRDGDMVTILQKPEGSDWWWASLCGREGFVPNNYFGLFPKVRPKTLC
ncbi:relA-associated inhibitor [Antennarius striatus]|uniref:relA-associated inhibitor n=1 Tax=Antennarius striatus TaxID=241820 RepID=UPI0035B110BA